MSTLRQAWYNSLTMLTPKNLKPWLYATITGSLETYKVLVIYFWWLLIIILGTLYYFKTPYNWATAVSLVVWMIVCFLAARPAQHRKDYRYFFNYWLHAILAVCIAFLLGWALLLCTLLLVLLLMLVIQTIVKITGGSTGEGALLFLFATMGIMQFFTLSFSSQMFMMLTGNWVHYSTLWIVTIALSGFNLPILYSLLFLFDAPASEHLKSIIQGFRLAWHNYPFLFIIQIPAQIIAWYYILDIYALVPFCLLFPFYLNFFMYLYYKRTHQHPQYGEKII